MTGREGEGERERTGGREGRKGVGEGMKRKEREMKSEEGSEGSGGLH